MKSEVLTAAALLLGSAPATGAEGSDLSAGKPFPAIYLPALSEGGLRGIDSFRGKKLVLHIFASW